MDPMTDPALNRWGCNLLHVTGDSRVRGLRASSDRKSGWVAAGVCEKQGSSPVLPRLGGVAFISVAARSALNLRISRSESQRVREGGGSDRGVLLSLCLSPSKGSPCWGICLIDQNCGVCPWLLRGWGTRGTALHPFFYHGH